MNHEYQENEVVTISRKNYDEIKGGYDSKFIDVKEATEAVLEENKKLKQAVCVVTIVDGYESSRRTISSTILNTTSEFYRVADKYFKNNAGLESDLKLVEKRITDFQNSFTGKFLNFFGVKI